MASTEAALAMVFKREHNFRNINLILTSTATQSMQQIKYQKFTRWPAGLLQRSHLYQLPLFLRNPFLLQRRGNCSLKHRAQVLAVKVTPDSSLQFGCALAENLCQVVQIIASSDPKLPYKILCSALQVPVFLPSVWLIRTSKVCV